MEKLNWTNFELKNNGKQESSFQNLAKELFCSEFNITTGLTEYKNHPGIETNPIFVGNKNIGFQAKYTSSSVTLASKKKTIIDSILIAKENEKFLDIIHIYVNKLQTTSSNKGLKQSKFITDIENKAKEVDIELVWHFSDSISNQLMNPKNKNIVKTYFPEFIEKNLAKNDKIGKAYSLDIHRTAIIQIEIAKLKFGFSHDWKKNEEILNRLSTYADFSNEVIAKEIFEFLNYHVSPLARSNMPSDIALQINSLILNYFPSSFDDKNKSLRIQNGKLCVEIGFNLIYDAFIYSKNYKVAQWGLLSWKYIYRESKRNNNIKLGQLVLNQYEELESTLNRPDSDLDIAKEMLQLFKDDLETFGISFPLLPKHIYKLTLSNDKN